ncbi:MAG: hypothetical protein HETSPECPRED_006453 [Heterodermia speciosa]|uniref:Uncharacterized protein n=1 Tax=Heterodermia speciosa TaxID=116794 RepID=A0A8H3ITB9_9LECA|nr:MAG: hypothetical protein HETSPECPRED_006453 [Heterodermia speciosa]
MACSRGWRDQTPERAVDEDQRHVHGIGNLAHRLERARSRVPSSWFRGKQIARKQLTLTAPILIVKSGSYPHPEAILMERRGLSGPTAHSEGIDNLLILLVLEHRAVQTRGKPQSPPPPEIVLTLASAQANRWLDAFTPVAAANWDVRNAQHRPGLLTNLTHDAIPHPS